MPQIPNTNTAGYFLQSLGDGSNTSKWGTPSVSFYTGTLSGSVISLNQTGGSIGGLGYYNTIGTISLSVYTKYLVLVQINAISSSGSTYISWTLTGSGGGSTGPILDVYSFGILTGFGSIGFSGSNVVQLTSTAAQTVDLVCVASATGASAACNSIYAIGLQ